MQVTSATSPFATAATTSSSTTSGASSTPPVTSGNSLNQTDFLKLLAVQFQQQDPMQPMDDTSFIAQMAQFTSLSQTSTLVQQMTQMAASQGASAANSYLGKQVTLTDSNNQSVTGVVSAVDSSSGSPQLVVNGNSYDLSTVTRVQPDPGTGVAPSATPTSTSVKQ